jgi:DNA-binding NtrC family response regulator
MERINQTMKQEFVLDAGALQRLKLYDYPGNVRELRNVLFVAASHCAGTTIDAGLVEKVLDDHQKSRQRETAEDVSAAPAGAARTADSREAAPTLKDVEARHIADLLQKHNHSRKEVAAALGVSERTLYRKLKRYALN